MAISAARIDERITDVRVTAMTLEVDLRDGRHLSVPLDWFPRLAAAPDAARANWELSAAGYGVHWPELDEDVGVTGLLRSAQSTG
jgi:hypothetical protein